MGFLDVLKKAGGAVVDTAKNPGPALKIATAPVTKPTAWAWNNTIGEWGDRDYVPGTEGEVVGARSVQEGQQDLLFGRPAADLPDPQQYNSWEPGRYQPVLGARRTPLGDIAQGLDASRRGLQPSQARTVGEVAAFHDTRRQAGRDQLEARKQMEDEIVDRLQGDWEQLLGDDPNYDEIADWKMLSESVVQVMENAKDDEGNITDEEMWGGGQAILNQHYQTLRPHLEVVAPGWFDENFEFDEGYSFAGRKLRGAAAPFIEAFRQIAAHQLAGIENIKLGVEELVTGRDRVDWGVSDNLWKGNDPGRSTSFREVILGDPDLGGPFWGGVLDLAVEIGIDPTTYLSFGTSSAAAATIRNTAEQAIAESAEAAVRHATYSRIIKERGWSALDDLGQAEMEKWIRKDAIAIATRQGRNYSARARTKLNQLIKGQNDKILKLEERIAKVGDRNLERVAKQGRAGVRAGGQTILPTGGIGGRLGLTSKGVFEEYTDYADLGRTETFRRAGDDIFEEVTEVIPGAVRGVADESLDPRIEFLRRKAASTPFAEEADAFIRKADELAEKLRKGAAPAQDIEYLTRMVKVGNEWIDEVVPVLDPVVRERLVRVDPGLLSGRFSELRGLFIPRAGLIDTIGRDRADLFRQSVIEAQGLANELSQRVNQRLDRKLARRAMKEMGFGRNADELDAFLSRALSDPEYMTRAITEGGEATEQLLRSLSEVRKEIWDELARTQPELLERLSKDTYIPRVFTKKGRRWLENISPEDRQKIAKAAADGNADASGLLNLIQDLKSEKAAQLKQKSLRDAFTEPRSIRPEIQDLVELNEEVSQMFRDMGIKNPEDLFETNVLASWSLRADSAYRAKMINDIIDGLTELPDELGDMMAVHANDFRRLSINNPKLKKPSKHDFGDYYIHEDLIRPMEELNQILLNPDKLKKLGQLSNSFQSIWARYATLSPGFHTRNMLGNVFNAFLGGLTNPIQFVRAAELQFKQWRIRKLMKAEGLSWNRAALRLGIDEVDLRLIQDMQAYRISSGTVGDVFKDKDVTQFSFRKMADLRNVSRFNVTTLSRNLGTMIEHNSRMALYIDAIEKGMPPAQAAAHVKHFLFDYDDLTSFETGVRRHLSRFYTFMRKNTALQAQMLVTRPGRQANAMRIVDSSTDMLFGAPDEEGMQLPAWAEVAGMRSRGGDAIGFETPFTAAANTVEDAMAIPLALAEISGVPLDKLPDTVTDALLYENVQNRISQGLGLFSGLPKATADFLYGQATGYDPFTGALVGYDNPRVGERPGLFELLGVMNPMVSRAERWLEDIEKVTGQNRFGDWGATQEEIDELIEKQDLGLTLWNIFGGVQVYENDRLQRSAVNTMQRALEEELRKLGDDKLTMDELRREGRVDYVNRFMHIMVYGGIRADGESEIMNQLAGLVPKEILEYYVNRNQLQADLVENREYSTQLRPRDEMERAIKALPEVKAALEQLIGRPLNQQEEINLILTSGPAPWMSELEAYGIEGFRDYADLERNTFTKDQYAVEREDRVRSTINALGSVFSIDFDTLLAARPLLDETSRVIEQARLAGASEADVFQYLVEESSRLDINVMFGEAALSTHRWGGFGARDEARQINAAWEDRAKFVWLYEYVNGYPPTQAEINRAVAHMNIGRTDQRYLIEDGLLSDLGPYPPSRENIQSEAEMRSDARRELGAVLEGASGNRYMGLYPEADERKSIELGGADWLYGENRFEDAPNFQLAD